MSLIFDVYYTFSKNFTKQKEICTLNLRIFCMIHSLNSIVKSNVFIILLINKKELKSYFIGNRVVIKGC